MQSAAKAALALVMLSALFSLHSLQIALFRERGPLDLFQVAISSCLVEFWLQYRIPVYPHFCLFICRLLVWSVPSSSSSRGSLAWSIHHPTLLGLSHI